MSKQLFSAFTKAPVLLVALAIALALPLISLPEFAHADMNNTRADLWGTPELTGSGWLSRGGVDVNSNGSSIYGPSTDTYNCFTIAGGAGDVNLGCPTGTVPTGIKWQCVELVNRLALTKGWIATRWAGDGNTLINSVPTGFTKELQGHISYLNPGDIITLDETGTTGHAGIINTVSSTIETINQNTVAVKNNTSVVSGTSFSAGNAQLASYLPGYTVQAIVHAPTPSPNYSMLLDSGGAVWAQQGASANWTSETPANALEKAIAAGSGIQMLMDGGGAVWAQQGLSSSWTLETPANAGEKAIAVGGGTQMLIDSTGAVWARTASTVGTGWTQETPTGSGEVAIAAGRNGLQMLLDAGGAVWAKSSIGNGGWTQETPTNSGGKAIAAGDIQMLVDSGGQVWAQSASSFTTSWTPETSANAGEKAIAAGNGVQMLIDAGGAVWARPTASLGTTWTLETPANAGEVAIAAGASNLQMLLDAGGAVWAQNGSTLSTSWTSETPANAGEKAIAAGS